MCIIFVYACKEPEDNCEGYSLIVANNRDEFLDRPTKEISFLDEQQNIICGCDMQPGRSRGTWLAFSKQGRFASLLNILLPEIPLDDSKKGRGHLALDYVTGAVSTENFLDNVHEHRNEYNFFNLVVGERKTPLSMVLHCSNGCWSVSAYSTLEERPQSFNVLENVFSISNHMPSRPWRKTTEGCSKFSQIVNEHNSAGQKVALQNKLIDLLNDKTYYLPDPHLEKQSGQEKVPGYIKKRSAVFVSLPEINYGTRTNSVILVDWKGHVSFLERTMTGQMNELDWSVNEFEFDINRSLSQAAL